MTLSSYNLCEPVPFSKGGELRRGSTTLNNAGHTSWDLGSLLPLLWGLCSPQLSGNYQGNPSCGCGLHMEEGVFKFGKEYNVSL